MRNILTLILFLLLFPVVHAENGRIFGEGMDTIIGDDDREPSRLILNRNIIKKVGQLESYYQGFSTLCSATAVGPNLVLTAAHCLFDRSGILAKKAKFFPGRNEIKSAPHGAFEVEAVYFPREYLVEHSTDYDIAFVKVAKNEAGKTLGDAIGFLPLFYGDLSFQQSLLTLGYPGDLVSGRQYGARCNFRGYYGVYLYFDCDVMSGQSGSPLLTYKGADGLSIIGVVTSSLKNLNENGGTRIDEHRFDIYQMILSEDFPIDGYYLNWRSENL